MSNLAIKKDSFIRQGQILNDLLDRLKTDKDFYDEVINSTDIKKTLLDKGIKLDESIMTMFYNKIRSIKKMIKMELGKITDIICSGGEFASSGNGAGGW